MNVITAMRYDTILHDFENRLTENDIKIKSVQKSIISNPLRALSYDYLDVLCEKTIMQGYLIELIDILKNLEAEALLSDARNRIVEYLLRYGNINDKLSVIKFNCIREIYGIYKGVQL